MYIEARVSVVLSEREKLRAQARIAAELATRRPGAEIGIYFTGDPAFGPEWIEIDRGWIRVCGPSDPDLVADVSSSVEIGIG